MHYTKFKLNEFVVKSQRILNVTQQNSHVREAVDQYGYAEERIAEGRRLYESLNETVERQQRIVGSKVACMAEKADKHEQVARLYMKYLKIARIVFESDAEAQVALILRGPRERVYEKWFYQVSAFCNNLMATTDFVDRLHVFGLEMKHIEGLKEELNHLQLLSDKCMRMLAEVRKVVSERKQKTIRWQQWLSDYIKIVRIAVQDSDQVSQRWIRQLLSKGE